MTTTRPPVVAEPLEARRLLSTVLPNGGVITDSISVVGEQDMYQFTAAAGETILLGLQDRTGGGFTPRLTLLSPDGTQLLDVATDSGRDDEVAAPTGGTYTALVRENQGDAAGDYGLSLLRLPPLAAPRIADADDGDRALSNGGAILGRINDSGTDFDVFTFDAVAGNTIVLGLQDRTGGGFTPRLTLFGPSGSRLLDVATDSGRDDEVLAGTSGTYAVLVRENQGDAAGDYGLSLLRLPPLAAPRVADADDGDRALSNGNVTTGRIDAAGIDSDVFTFQAQAGESILIGLQDRTGGGFTPRLTLFAPDGGELLDVATDTGRIDEVPAPLAGTYAVLVRENQADAAGNYGVSIARAPAALSDIDGGLLRNGEQILGNVPFGDLDVYAFEANPGDNIIAAAGDTSGTNNDVQLRIYGPDGQLIGGEAGETGLDLDLVAPQGGTYYAVVNEFGGNGSIDYTLTVAAFPGSLPVDPFDVDSGPLASGQVRGGSVRLAEVDVFTFNAGFGDSFSVGVRETIGTNSTDVRLDVYDPDGELLGTQSGETTATVDVASAPAFGTYYAVVRELGSNASIGYTVGLDATPGADSFAPVVAGTRFNFEEGQSVDFVLSERAAGLSFRDFEVRNLTTGDTFAPTLEFSDLTNVARLTFPDLAGGVLPDGNYRATLEAGSFTDLFGNPFGDAASLDFFVLAGDFNRDRSVNLSDFTILANNFGRGGRTFSRGDANYDGQVNLSDFTVLANRFGATLPPPAGDDEGDDEGGLF